MKTKRIAIIVAVVLVCAAAAAIAVLRSAWFERQVRARAVAELERATGARVEAAAFRFDWKRMRAEIDGLVLHGTEAAGKPPLLRAETVAAGLKIVSLARRDVDVRYLEVKAPRIYLIVYPDGHTNIPEPGEKHGARSPIETLVNLAVARFSIEHGVFQVEGQGETAFDASGDRFIAKFDYERAAARYRGSLSVNPLLMTWGGRQVPVDVDTSLAIAANRIEIASARLATGASQVEFSGAIENFAAPRTSLHFQASGDTADVRRVISIPGVEAGKVDASGDANFTGIQEYSANGNWRANDVVFRQDSVDVRKLAAQGGFEAGPNSLQLSGVQLSAEPVLQRRPTAVEGRVASVSIRKGFADARGVSLSISGGTFAGDTSLAADGRFQVRGEISGLEARRAVELYGSEPLPWNSLLSGAVSVEGSLHRKNEFRLSAALKLEPAATGSPVSGHVTAEYDARAGTLNLGSSVVNLPSSRAEFSGSIGREIRGRLETRNLNDFLPVLGRSAGTLPFKLEEGSLTFDGTVTGQLENPVIAGHVNLAKFAVENETFDSLETGLRLSPRSLRLDNASLARGDLRAHFQAAVALENWQTSSHASIAGNGTVRNANLAEALALLGRKDLSATGTLNATGQFSGTLAEPRAEGQVEIVKGSIEAEPFDRFMAHLAYAAGKLDASAGQIAARAKQVRFTANVEKNRVRFNIQTNNMPLEQIDRLAKAHPGLKGTVQVAANGAADFGSGRPRISGVTADVRTRGIAIDGTALGDAHLTATSEGQLLRARLNSDIANAGVQGEGEWKLDGDYPGSAHLTFSRLDFNQVREWIAPAKSPSNVQGFAEGEIRVDGPAAKPDLLKGELRINKLEFGPVAAAQFTLHNEGPILATAANSVVTINTARLVGAATDLNIAGKVLLNQKSPLELRADGRLDMGVLQELNRDLTATGAATLEASIRGAIQQPDVNGRLDVQNVSLNYGGFSNGISNATGSIAFAGERATIRTLTAETGGGKVQFTGFAEYTGGEAIFRLHADAARVRVRYPEGFSNVVDANLNFTGTTERSMLAGNVTVLRSTVNLESDFSSLLAKSSEPVQLPVANTGFWGGLNFDVQVQTAPDVQIESSLTQGVQADATLRLRGTATNPAVLGRVNIAQGQATFFGTKYNINQGSVSFFNPIKIEPVLDVDLETKARGVQVTLTVAGPLNKLTVTPRSDPPLQTNEVISLLATGSSPSTDTGLRLQQTALPPAAQQSTASAVLGQAIASPVTGRLQRFFGLSGIRIDPGLPGFEYNPQARLTLQQQVTPDVTFTYIANVTQANPQVVSVEWSVSKQWSVVAQREENGLVGLDFFFKRRFK